MRPKVSIIGAGNVGASCAQRLFDKGYADLVLLDIVDGLAQGKALDILQCGPVTGSDARIVGTTSFKDTADSKVVVITSGLARKPGMSRDDLVLANMEVVKGVTEQVSRHSPEAILILVTNPLDAMTHLALKVSKFNRERVIGQSGILDTTRLKTFIAAELGVSVRDVSALVLGGHGDTMVPLPRLCSVGGVPLTELLPPATVDRLVKRAIKGGGEIVELLKTGSAFYAPSASVAEMVEAIISGANRVLTCAVYLDGEYGITGAVVGVPVKLGSGGIEQIIEVKLLPEEQEALKRSAAAVREITDIMKL